MASSLSHFTTCLENAALALAEDREAKTLSDQDTPFPSDKSGKALSAAEVAQILIDLPGGTNIRKLLNSVEERSKNFSVKLLEDWCTLRQTFDQEERERGIAEKENVPPLALDHGMPTSIPERRPGSSANLPRVTPLTNASPPSPLLHPSSSQSYTATRPKASSSLAPSPSSNVLPISAGRSEESHAANPPFDIDVAAIPFDEATSDRNEDQAKGPTPDLGVTNDTLGIPSIPDEENQITTTVSSLSPISRSPSSSPQHNSKFSQESSSSIPIVPLPGNRLVRSKAVRNFSALRKDLISIDNAAAADAEADFFNTPSDKANDSNPFLLPTLVADFDHDDLPSPSRAPRTGTVGCSMQPFAVAERDGPGSPVGGNEGGHKRKRGMEDDEGDEEGRRRSLLQTAGSSGVAAQQSRVVIPEEGGRGRKRTREEAQTSAEDRPARRARRHDGFVANLVHSRFIPQYLQYYL